MSETTSRPFLVDLRGVIDLLGRHIYSGPQVFVRELLQNGRDAITARAEHEGRLDPAWGVRILPPEPGERTLRVVDDGVGLTAEEVGDLLATVGRSSKRDLLDLPREGFLGQFGIGLLSCFMVADRITVRSRSARDGSSVEWVGAIDGTFAVRALDDAEAADLAVGTVVALEPRADDAHYRERATLDDLARRYAEYLPVPIAVRAADGTFDTINRRPVFAATGAERTAARGELRELGQELLGRAPFDVIELHSPATGTRGTAFVLPVEPAPGARRADRVHLGGMLVDPRADDLLPSWAFFVRAVVDSSGLKPTASREHLVEDEALEATRAELGAAVRAWVLRLGVEQPRRLAEFVGIHHLGLKSLVVHDEELAAFITRWLTVETSIGVMTIDELVREHPHLRYTETVDEFRQIAAIASPDRPVVNGGYVHDADIVRQLPLRFEGVTVERATVAAELDVLDPPPLAERSAALELERRAGAALAEVRCDVVVRRFEPADLPGLYLADPEALRSLTRDAAREASGALWSGVLGRLGEARAAARPAAADRPKLCLNWANPLVRSLATAADEAVVDRTVRLLYVQALLAGHRPLGTAERRMLTGALGDLVALSLAD
ncbi:HSP90 family protein [Agromyces seonyuensis]|uniref:HSP90 family protein n=1 Tax=Agromyces seonyuensis TaxID=2662446 RepID=A0A6I4P1V2_9MICO|nr:HSP90 family protein [Agromyces seonyuensis]MWB99532.1 HSP90 family protein [Agromyces seonyuensis]